jgi:hypothetical protein
LVDLDFAADTAEAEEDVEEPEERLLEVVFLAVPVRRRVEGAGAGER